MDRQHESREIRTPEAFADLLRLHGTDLPAEGEMTSLRKPLTAAGKVMFTPPLCSRVSGKPPVNLYYLSRDTSAISSTAAFPSKS